MIEKEGPIHVSNVAIVDPKDKQADARRHPPRRQRQPHARHQALRSGAGLTWHDSRTATTTRSAPALVRKFGYSYADAGAAAEKVTLNMGVGEAKQDSKMLEAAQEQLADIAGQKPNIRRARKSVAAFKLREGMPVGPDRHAARRARVRVPRPPDLDRDPADPRLPRAQPAVLRRPRQLQHGHPRADHLPGDRLRQHRPGPRARRRHSRRPRRPTPRRSRCSTRSGMPFARDGRPAGFESLAGEPVAA